MDKTKFYISTAASDAHDVAVKNGFGIEIAEYCTASVMPMKSISPSAAYIKSKNLPLGVKIPLPISRKTGNCGRTAS